MKVSKPRLLNKFFTNDIFQMYFFPLGDTILTREYCQTIEQIFHQLDLDENDCLSRAEFNLYNWRTSGLEINVSLHVILNTGTWSLIHIKGLAIKILHTWLIFWTMGNLKNVVWTSSAIEVRTIIARAGTRTRDLWGSIF